jgi:putative DNA primase/helicase
MGFLARFLVTSPKSTQGFRPYTEPPPNWPSLAAFHSRLQTLLDTPAPINEAGALEPTMLKLSPEAKAEWVKFHDDVEVELSADGELYDVRDVASKAAENVARLAALFHVIEHGPGGVIGADSLKNAAQIVAWHLTEAQRFFGELALPVDLANAVKLDGWLLAHCQKKGENSIARRDVQRLGPNRLRKSKALDAAIEFLVEADRVRLDEGNRRKQLRISPLLLDKTDGLA